jgi:murein DD-endopeptidase MepM/ murein hydrolase activator NlpD
MRYPLDYWKITQGFSLQHPAYDLVGSKEIKASANGIVYYVYHFNPSIGLFDPQGNVWNNTGGNFVIVKVDNSDLYYYNGHMSQIQASTGQRILENQLIGYVGSTGYASGEHLHHEWRKGSTWENGKSVNPSIILNNQPQGGTMADYSWLEDLGNPNNPNTVVNSHINPTLKAVGESTSRPLSEKVKVLADYAKQVPELKKQLKIAQQNVTYVPVGQLFVKK